MATAILAYFVFYIVYRMAALEVLRYYSFNTKYGNIGISYDGAICDILGIIRFILIPIVGEFLAIAACIMSYQDYKHYGKRV